MYVQWGMIYSIKKDEGKCGRGGFWPIPQSFVELTLIICDMGALCLCCVASICTLTNGLGDPNTGSMEPVLTAVTADHEAVVMRFLADAPQTLRVIILPFFLLL